MAARWAAFSRAPGRGAVAVRCWAGAFFTLHGVVFAILSSGSAVQRPPRPGHETVNASRLATRRFNSKPSCSSRGNLFHAGAAVQVRLDLQPGPAAEPRAVDLQVLHDPLHVIAGLRE